MLPLWYLSVTVHILAAILWVGGQAFMILALMPALREPAHRAVARTMLVSSIHRYGRVSTVCLHLLALTGLFNLWFRTGFNLQSPVTHAGLTKAMLWLVLLAISLYHDKVLGKRTVEAWARDPGGAETLALRRKSMLLGRVGFLLAVLMVFLGMWIVRPV